MKKIAIILTMAAVGFLAACDDKETMRQAAADNVVNSEPLMIAKTPNGTLLWKVKDNTSGDGRFVYFAESFNGNNTTTYEQHSCGKNCITSQSVPTTGK